MKTKSSKLLKVCFVLVAFVFFAAALLFPVNAFSASADGYDPGPAPEPPTPDPDPEAQLPIYYISDSSASESIAWDIEQKTRGTVYLTQYTPGSTLDKQTQALNDLWAEVNFSEIEESYVIFEFETPFDLKKENDSQELAPDLLKSIFSTLKANDCYIMFICGTDEYLFRKNNEFLDYVDIHVNTDKLETFFTSICYQIMLNDNNDMQIGYSVFFLDQNIAPHKDVAPDSIYMNRFCNFVRFYFVRFIKLVFMEEIRYGDDFVMDVLRNNYIEILCHVQGDEYYDIVNTCYVNLYQNDYLFQQHEWFYAIGTNENGKTYSEEWITEIRQACEAYARNFTVFYYEYEEHGFGESWYEPTEFGTLLTALGSAPLYLEPIMLDFVRVKDMYFYDNWTGRCEITHKVRMTNDGDGWLVNLLDFLDLDEETESYLEDESDVWY